MEGLACVVVVDVVLMRVGRVGLSSRDLPASKF